MADNIRIVLEDDIEVLIPTQYMINGFLGKLPAWVTDTTISGGKRFGLKKLLQSGLALLGIEHNIPRDVDFINTFLLSALSQVLGELSADAWPMECETVVDATSNRLIYKVIGISPASDSAASGTASTPALTGSSESDTGESGNTDQGRVIGQIVGVGNNGIGQDDGGQADCDQDAGKVRSGEVVRAGREARSEGQSTVIWSADYFVQRS